MAGPAPGPGRAYDELRSAPLQAMEAAVACGSGVVDWAMRHASLEDVFIDIAKLARAKSHDMP